MAITLPLVALRAFSEVGRTGGIKAAAAALCITPGAVSQQVRSLEAWLGVELFERRNRRLVFTDAGAGLHAAIGDSFLAIEEAAQSFKRRKRSDKLVVSTCGGLATAWLLPRLGTFQELHPDIEVHVESTSRIVDLYSEPVDVALRPGDALDRSLVADRFLDARLLPVANPALTAGGPTVGTARDILRYTLLQDGQRSRWTAWLARHGIKDARSRQGPAFDDPSLAAQAALRGQGIALIWDVYVRNELESGALVPVLPTDDATFYGYYCVALPGSAKLRKVRVFRDWITGQVESRRALQG